MTRWGICCDDPRFQPWLAGFARSSTLPSFLAAEFSPATQSCYAAVPRVERCAGWEPLLVASSLQAIIAGGISDEAHTAIRQLMQSEVPLYVRPHPSQGLSLAYELTLLAAERSVPVRPLWPQRTPPLLIAARTWLQQQLQPLRFVELNRTLAASTISGHELDEWLLQQQLDDLELLRWFGLQASRVTALRTSRPESQHRRLAITLDAEDGVQGLWSGETDIGSPNRGLLSVQCADGRIMLEQTESGTWQQSAGPDLSPYLPGEPLWLDDDATWDEAVQVFEWMDATTRALERRRSIELHNEPLSERTIFKTQMAALGCAVLCATLFLGLGYLALAAVIPLPAGVLRVGRILVFAPLFLFLAAQLLLPLTRAPRGRSPISGD